MYECRLLRLHFPYHDGKIEKTHAHNAKSRCLSRRCLPACLPPCGLAGSRYYSLLLASNGSRYAVYSRAKPDREGSSARQKNS